MLGSFRRALVTGGAGFVGSHLCERLLEEGLEVVCLDNYVAGKPENIAALRDAPGFVAGDCDVVDFEGVRKWMEGVDVVFHNAASKCTVCLRDPRRDLDVNAKGTFNLLEAARQCGVRKFVHASTGSVYGEPQYFPEDEEHPTRPSSFYGVSKLAGEGYCRVFAKMYGMDITVLRYFHVYGPRQDSSDYGGVIPIFCRRVLNGEPPIIFGDGTQVRSFTYVNDDVAINLAAATNPAMSGQCYNCASGIQVTIGELAQLVLKHFGRPDLEPVYRDWKPGDIRVFKVANAKVKDATGIEFTSFEDGLRETAEWYRSRLAREASQHV